MAVSDVVNLAGLLDEARCFELVRQHRWPEGVRCPECDSAAVIRNGHDEAQPHRHGLGRGREALPAERADRRGGADARRAAVYLREVVSWRISELENG